jgi:subtilisin family serine protease
LPRPRLPVLAVALLSLTSVAAAPAPRPSDRPYLVVYDEGASSAAARAAVRRAGGRIVTENRGVGVATVRSSEDGFAPELRRAAAIDAVAAQRPVGRAPAYRPKPDFLDRVLRAEGAVQAAPAAPADAQAEPFSTVQWNMAMIDADQGGSHRVEEGSPEVLVGILDTGIEGAHPDIAPNFDAGLSRNFTRDDPLIDGPCEEEPDRSCEDPPHEDAGGHGTFVAGVVGAALNGVGVGGVAPRTRLVNLRVGQESGYMFLQPVVDALTYAGDNGVDVVNMSFFVDPWLFNCAANPADSAEEQAQQRAIIEGMGRALAYARERDVTLVAALGNEAMDLGAPTEDPISPDYPPGSSRTRTVDNSCLNLPTEGEGVLSVSALGPSGLRAGYSNYGLEQNDLSAPGGDLTAFAGTAAFRAPTNGILSPTSEAWLRSSDALEPDGTPKDATVLRECREGSCAYWEYSQGTSFAAPHVTGVAALVVARGGSPDPRGGLTMAPEEVERVVLESASDEACPKPAAPGPTCEGPPERNGFYGDGIVNALEAVSGAPVR